MKKTALSLCLLFCLCLVCACGDDKGDKGDQARLSEDGKDIVKEVGGPFTTDEFAKFMEDLPKIPGLTKESRLQVEERSGADLTSSVLAGVKAQGWDEQRFMYIYSHTMAVVNTQLMENVATQLKSQIDDLPEEQKQMLQQAMDEQMGGNMDGLQAELDKQVPLSEQTIIQNNMDQLLTILGIK